MAIHFKMLFLIKKYKDPFKCPHAKIISVNKDGNNIKYYSQI